MSRRLLLGLGALLAACDGGESDPSLPAPLPVAHDDSFTIAEDSTNAITRTKLLENDEHIGSSTSVTYSMPAHGTASNGAYIPYPGYFGTDSFTYTVKGVNGYTTTATVTVTVTSDAVPFEHAVQLDDGSAWALAAGDLDGDGKADLVTAEAGTSSLVVLANRTTVPEKFIAERFGFEGGHSPVGVALADIDGDGKLDMISAAKDDGLVVLRNITVAGGPLSFAGPVYLTTKHAISVVATDLNGDGKPDLAAIDDYDDDLEVWINASTPGTAAFGPRFAFAAPDGPTQLLVDDADGDGTPDLAVLGRTRGELSLFLNATVVGNTTPVFSARIDRGTGTQPSGMFLADLDGDGDQEIAVMHDSEALWLYANRNAMPGTPSFEAARVLDLPLANATFVAPVDVDGQGAIDVMMATAGDQPSQFLLNKTMQQGTYSFDPAAARIGDSARRSRVTYGTPTGITLVELDGVAPKEIVVSSRSGSSGLTGTFVLFGR
ncbi:MAG: VCBS repeat-containing protein [Deltaproteobacteria bacterium]|nr:VCBS repeat-containing protein [Deltaproteobacteria bacterium]